MVVFGSSAELGIKLNKYHEHSNLTDAVKRLEYPGSDTFTAGGLQVAHTHMFTEHNGDRANASNVAILITAGVSTIDQNDTIPNAQDLHRDGIRVICIGIGDGISEDELSAISSPPHKKNKDYFIRSDFSSLAHFTITLAERINEAQAITVSRNISNTSDDGEYEQ